MKKSFFGGKKAAVNKEPPVDIPQKKAFSFGAKKAAPEPEPEPEPVKKPMFSFGGTMKMKRARARRVARAEISSPSRCRRSPCSPSAAP